MSDSDARNRLKALFAARQGADLIDAIADEIADLQAQTSRIAEELRLLPVYQSFSERLGLLMDNSIGEGVLPDRLTLDASHLFVAENGFYGIEHDESGAAYRWTGPRRDFSFVVYLDRRTPLRLELELANMADPKLQSDILLLVDGTNVPLKISQFKKGYVGHAILPERDRTRATSLIFVVPCVLPEPKGLDPRHFGVAFRELRIEPASRDIETAEPAESVQEDELASAAGWLMSEQSVLVPDPVKLVDSISFDQQHAARSTGPGSSSPFLPRVARIDADRIENGTKGFFGLEQDRDGRKYRWTGPGKTFSLVVPIDRSHDSTVRLCLVGFVDRARQTPLTLTVDQVTCQLTLSNDSDGIIASVALPRTSSPGPTTLTFEVPAVLNPSNADRRFLGVAFRYLVVEPKSRSVATMRLFGQIRRRASQILSAVARDDLKKPAQSAP